MLMLLQWDQLLLIAQQRTLEAWQQDSPAKKALATSRNCAFQL
jgi:hypothetical protein